MTMDTNTRDDLGGFGFGQHEPLVRRLHNLLRDYPEGVGIVKELIQNADDAGATIVRLTVDYRSHHNVNVPDPRMGGLLGPALLFYNDAKFTESDFQNIQEISFSGKSNDLGKTGRYGIGFNSVYHVSDCPSTFSR
jgi:sacsin